jgi:hypothetical protein
VILEITVPVLKRRNVQGRLGLGRRVARAGVMSGRRGITSEQLPCKRRRGTVGLVLRTFCHGCLRRRLKTTPECPSDAGYGLRCQSSAAIRPSPLRNPDGPLSARRSTRLHNVRLGSRRRPVPAGSCGRHPHRGDRAGMQQLSQDIDSSCVRVKRLLLRDTVLTDFDSWHEASAEF